MFEVDVYGTFYCCKLAIPLMRKVGGGVIVNNASISGIAADNGLHAYNAAKAAVINYASALSQQLAPKGIRVNTVSPGPVFIDGGSWDMIKTHMTALYDQTVKAVPMGRLGNGEEVAKAIAFMASPACPFMTGTNVVIDGGVTKRVQY